MRGVDGDEFRVALLGYGYWGPNLARNLHLRLGRAWVACVDPDPARRVEVARRYPWLGLLAMSGHGAGLTGW
jgi:predicted dehydrogenase